jgi:hypothetical protein
MASIFKRNKRKNEAYTIQYTDHLGQRRTKKGFTDKGLTEQLAAKLETEARLRSTGMIDARQEQLVREQNTAITEHLSKFKESLSDNSPKHVSVTMTRTTRIIEGCEFGTLAEINSERVQTFLRSLRKEEGFGHRTYNHYLQAFDSFLN